MTQIHSFSACFMVIFRPYWSIIPLGSPDGVLVMTKLTLKTAREILAGYNVTIRATEDSEYRVNFRGGAEATASYQNDLQDAVDTGVAMAMQGEKTLMDWSEDPSMLTRDTSTGVPGAEFQAAVTEALESMPADSELNADDMATVSAAIKYGVGPYDTACQIIANREDQASLIERS
jgi:hypothetical protein